MRKVCQIIPRAYVAVCPAERRRILGQVFVAVNGMRDVNIHRFAVKHHEQYLAGTRFHGVVLYGASLCVHLHGEEEELGGLP